MVESPEFLLCELCGERIGVYEPIVAIEDDVPRETALAREPELLRTRPKVMHALCAHRRRPA